MSSKQPPNRRRKTLLIAAATTMLAFAWYVSGTELSATGIRERVQTASNIFYTVAIPYFLFINSFYVIILFLGFINARRQHAASLTEIKTRLVPLRTLKPISILVPCYNEETSVEASLTSMLKLDYPNYEVIVCNDGSKDNTLAIMTEVFELYPVRMRPPSVLPSQPLRGVYKSRLYEHLTVLDKANGGKADALNACINFSQYPLICSVDSDSIIESEGLIHVAFPFIEDERTIACGGTILLANTKHHASTGGMTRVNQTVTPTWLGMIQGVEYIRAFLVGRLGWDMLGCNSIISGAFGLFRKSLVIKVGGYAAKTIGEDMELVIRMQEYCLKAREPFVIKMLPTPVCWTEPPTDLRTLGNQRTRWTQGLIESSWLHRDMLLRPWAGKLGMLALPYYILFELISAPIEIAGYLLAVTNIALGDTELTNFAAFFLATVAFGCLLNVGAILIDQFTFEKFARTCDVLKLLMGAFLEHFGFRQLHLFWRLRGIYRWLVGRQSWGEMKRVGIGPASTMAKKAA